MATNALIIVKTNDKYNVISLNYDGNPSHALRILEEHYNSRQLANSLIELGNLSVLGPKLYAEGHTIRNRQEGCTVAYTRDYKESWDMNKPRVYDSRIMIKFGESTKYYEYIYLWDGEWKRGI